ncbi:hypothetical protein OTSKARP_0294 [Orientia tsutsugamushi str. Karp]|nr:hypothetical protein OTSKARP_0294 [Orientia tsutsugamushi str. Karp]
MSIIITVIICNAAITACKIVKSQYHHYLRKRSDITVIAAHIRLLKSYFFMGKILTTQLLLKFLYLKGLW